MNAYLAGGGMGIESSKPSGAPAEDQEHQQQQELSTNGNNSGPVSNTEAQKLTEADLAQAAAAKKKEEEYEQAK